MLIPVKHLPINWTDGMKLSKKQLTESEDGLYDVIRDALSINIKRYNFGLLPAFAGEKQSTEFEINERSGNFIQVRLRRCNAITPSGIRIDAAPIDYSDVISLNYSFVNTDNINEGTENLYNIILTVNPFERLPTGNPDPEETPPRHPYVQKKYQLEIIPSDQVATEKLGPHHLIIGRIIQNGDRFSVDENYIPPCSSISSHEKLIKYYENFGEILNKLQITCFKIITKIHEKNTHSELSKNISSLCTVLLDYIASTYFKYRNIGYEEPPVMIIAYFSTITHLLSTQLNCLAPKQKEELLKYFYEWKDITPGHFEELLSSTINMIYNHQQINPAMMHIEKMLNTLLNLWEKMSSLEYIGQRKDSIIVTEKTIPEQSVQVKSGWSLID